jgi:hypothetical protein
MTLQVQAEPETWHWIPVNLNFLPSGWLRILYPTWQELCVPAHVTPFHLTYRIHTSHNIHSQLLAFNDTQTRGGQCTDTLCNVDQAPESPSRSLISEDPETYISRLRMCVLFIHSLHTHLLTICYVLVMTLDPGYEWAQALETKPCRIYLFKDGTQKHSSRIPGLGSKPMLGRALPSPAVGGFFFFPVPVWSITLCSLQWSFSTLASHCSY